MMFRQRREPHRLENASTSGNDRTPATNFASNAEILSFRQTRDNGNDRFKSVTGSNTTPSGTSPAYRIIDERHTQPARHQAKHGCLIQRLLNDARRFQAATETCVHHAVMVGGALPPRKSSAEQRQVLRRVRTAGTGPRPDMVSEGHKCIESALAKEKMRPSKNGLSAVWLALIDGLLGLHLICGHPVI